jgi:hypothetical protein
MSLMYLNLIIKEIRLMIDIFAQKREDNFVENPHVPAVRSGFLRNSLLVLRENIPYVNCI